MGPEEPVENFVEELALKVPGIDVIVFGHTHRELAGKTIGGSLVVQPRNWGMSLARIDVAMQRQGRAWKVADKQSRLIPVRPETEAAPDILELARPYHELAEAYLNTPVATSPTEQSAQLGRVTDSALVDAVHQVQLYYSKADVSLTALYNPSVRVPKGQVTVRQIAGLYPYDNELYAIQGTGKMLKEALENAARYYLSCAGARCGESPLTNREVIGFNYDMAEGVEYEVDLTRPEGDRIRHLTFQGKPLSPTQPLRIAINNYRAAGSAGYEMFKGAKVVWRSGEEIRDLLVRYYTERKTLPDQPSNNWRVVPETARKTLEKEAAAERPRNQYEINGSEILGGQRGILAGSCSPDRPQRRASRQRRPSTDSWNSRRISRLLLNRDLGPPAAATSSNTTTSSNASRTACLRDAHPPDGRRGQLRSEPRPEETGGGTRTAGLAASRVLSRVVTRPRLGRSDSRASWHAVPLSTSRAPPAAAGRPPRRSSSSPARGRRSANRRDAGAPSSARRPSSDVASVVVRIARQRGPQALHRLGVLAGPPLACSRD